MKSWVVLTVAVSVVTSLYSLLLTEGGSKKAFRTLSSVVLITVMLYPLTRISDDFTELDFYEFYDEFSVSFSDESNDVILEAVKSGYENLLGEKLLNNYHEIKGIKADVVYVNEAYDLKSVEIIFSQGSDNCDSIEAEVHKITDSECGVVFIDEF